jgi:hypothetical protein
MFNGYMMFKLRNVTDDGTLVSWVPDLTTRFLMPDSGELMGMYGHGRYGLSGEDLRLGGLARVRCFDLGRDLGRGFLAFGLWPGGVVRVELRRGGV